MPTRKVNLTEEPEGFVLSKVESGRCENGSEVVRAALGCLEREDREYEAKRTALRSAINDGDASGIGMGNPFERARGVSSGRSISRRPNSPSHHVQHSLSAPAPDQAPLRSTAIA